MPLNGSRAPKRAPALPHAQIRRPRPGAGIPAKERARKKEPTVRPTTKDYAATLEIKSRTVLEDELDRIVDDAIQHALANPGHGILVTRHSPGTFTIEISDEVPQGTITELDLATR